MIDIFVNARDLTGIVFVNILIWIESAGFMIIFIGPGLFKLGVESDHVDIGSIYLYILIATLCVGLILRMIQLPFVTIKLSKERKEKQEQEVDGIIAGWTKHRKAAKKLERKRDRKAVEAHYENSLSDGSEESSFSGSGGSDDSGENSAKRRIRYMRDILGRKKDPKVVVARYLNMIRERECESDATDTEDEDKLAKNDPNYNKFIAKFTVKNKRHLMYLLRLINVFEWLSYDFRLGKWRERTVRYSRKWKYVDGKVERIKYSSAKIDADVDAKQFFISETPVRDYINYLKRLTAADSSTTSIIDMRIMKPPPDLGLDQSDFDTSHNKKLLLSSNKLPSTLPRSSNLDPPKLRSQLAYNLKTQQMLHTKLLKFSLTPAETELISAELIKLMTDELHYTNLDDVSPLQVPDGIHY
jgi:hypothetical protein